LIELLAPAGSMEALRAAVENGANAVYLAGNAFGARAYADNFNNEALAEAIKYAHLRQVAVHVTVNTIVDESELGKLEEYLRFLAEAGADAVLVQDLGVARLAQQVVPHLPIHASTQMTVHNLAGVKALEDLGFSRVVLSRELSLDDISYICSHAKAEIEIFMHGALCVCYSGQCLMSSMIGGRSGNRGRCAQPCRLPYTLMEGETEVASGDGQYLLSPKDIKTLELLPQIIKAGVTSLKIEGRMKRPEYVAVVVDVYRRALDACLGQEKTMTQAEGLRRLGQIFNRDFSSAYLERNHGKKMMSLLRPNNRGLLVGRVEKYDRDRERVYLKLAESIAENDELDFWVKVGGRVTAKVKDLCGPDGKPCAVVEKGLIASFALKGIVHSHDRAFRVFDTRLMEEARRSFTAGSPLRRFDVKMQVEAKLGEPLRLTVKTAEGQSATAFTDVNCEKAQKRSLDEATLKKQLDRLGTSVYRLTDLAMELEEGIMVPISELNNVRRQAVEALDIQRLQSFPWRTAGEGSRLTEELAENYQQPRQAELVVSVADYVQAKVALEAGADSILFGGDSYRHQVLNIKDYTEVACLVHGKGKRLYFNTPRIVREKHREALTGLLCSFVELAPEAVYVHNIGSLQLVQELTDLPIRSDYSLIAYNASALRAMQALGISGVTLSPELNLKQVEKLAAQHILPLECIVHGRLELMVSEYCVLGSLLGGLDKGSCNGACLKGKEPFMLKDRKGELFPIVTDQFCHMHLLNAKTLSMLPFAMSFGKAGVARIRIEGKYLNHEELRSMVGKYKEISSLKDVLDEEQERFIREIEGEGITRGHYFRGVE